MTKPRQRQLQIVLAGLLAVLAVTLTVGNRMSFRPGTATAQSGGVKNEPPAPGEAEARIRLDRLDEGQDDASLGRNNVFQYRNRVTDSGRVPEKQAPPPPPPPPVVTQQPRPVGPPPVPPIPLKYQGLASLSAAPKSLIAILGDDASHHFKVVEGDVVMGKYLVTRISESSVDVQDLENNRKQTLPLIRQQ